MNEQWSEQSDAWLKQGSSCISGNVHHAAISSRTTGFIYNIDQAHAWLQANSTLLQYVVTQIGI